MKACCLLLWILLLLITYCQLLTITDHYNYSNCSAYSQPFCTDRLQPVSNVHFAVDMSSRTTITISWTPPFSLNLTTAEPDIQYCVDVYNVTGGGDDHLQSVCDITDTYYTFTASDPDQLFNFTVTPRSNVEGSLNGTTSQPVQGSLIEGTLFYYFSCSTRHGESHSIYD